MPQWIVEFAINHNLLIYGLIIVVAFFQGPLLGLVFGVLLSLGYLHFFPIYIALMLGDLVGDTIWYSVGRAYGQRFTARFGKYFGVTEHNIDTVTKLFHHYKNYVLFFSKITNGFGFAIVILITAGMVGIPFRMYLFINVLGQLIWTGALLTIGYYFSEAYIKIDDFFGRMTLIAFAILVAVALFNYWRYLRKKAENFNIQ